MAMRNKSRRGAISRRPKCRRNIIACRSAKRPSSAQGTAVTIVTWGTMVHVARAAIEEANLDAELIDLRTLVPLDLATISASVEKTGRCVVVHEAPRTCGFGAEIAALVQQHCFYSLEAPIERVTGWDTPFPQAQEWQYMPSRERITQVVQRTLAA